MVGRRDLAEIRCQHRMRLLQVREQSVGVVDSADGPHDQIGAEQHPHRPPAREDDDGERDPRKERAHGEDARVVDAMTPANEIPTGHSDQTLADIWDIMMKSGSRIVAIIDDRLFRGLVTLDDLGEVVHLVTTTGRYSQPSPVTVPPAGLPGSMDRGA